MKDWKKFRMKNGWNSGVKYLEFEEENDGQWA